MLLWMLFWTFFVSSLVVGVAKDYCFLFFANRNTPKKKGFLFEGKSFLW
jgi:hypothetical protein